LERVGLRAFFEYFITLTGIPVTPGELEESSDAIRFSISEGVVFVKENGETILILFLFFKSRKRSFMKSIASSSGTAEGNVRSFMNLLKLLAISALSVIIEPLASLMLFIDEEVDDFLV
jgi:hypothetical protein